MAVAEKRRDEATPHLAPIQMRDGVGRLDGLFFIVDDKPGDAAVDHFWRGAVTIGDHRRAASHRLDADQSERLWPLDREEQRLGAAEEVGLLVVGDFADVVDQRIGRAAAGSRASNQALSAESTLAAIRSGLPRRLAMAIARSGPFSGDIRPRNARYPRGRGSKR